MGLVSTATRLNFFPTTINGWENNASVSSGGERLHQASQSYLTTINAGYRAILLRMEAKLGLSVLTWSRTKSSARTPMHFIRGNLHFCMSHLWNEILANSETMIHSRDFSLVPSFLAILLRREIGQCTWVAASSCPRWQPGWSRLFLHPTPSQRQFET